MASKHPSDAIFKKFPDVSSESLTVDDSLAVQKALGAERIINIGRALGLSKERVDNIEKLHRHSPSRQAIAIVDTWLRGNFNDQRPPYTIPGNTPHPSWRSLVWAVAHNVGGNNPAKAKTIAQKYKEYQMTKPEPKYEKISTEEFNEGEGEQISGKLEQVWSRWYEIGFGLKVPTEKLDEIELGDGSFQEKMARMIDVWVRVFAVADESPCWRQLVEAVAASHGGQNPALAKTLAQDPEIATATESESMEVESVPAPTSTSGTEREQQNGGGVRIDSSLQMAPTQQQLEEVEFVNIAADGGGQSNIDDFVVYRCNKLTKGHGLAVIISNENFDPDSKLSTRICAPYDQARLEKHLSALGYRVVVRKDQTGAEIEKIFEAIGKNDPKEPKLHVKQEDDSFICVISSHGEWDGTKNTDVICGRDRGHVDLKQTAYSMLGTTACELLKGKPKIFFIQACRGDQAGMLADDSGPKAVPKQLPRESDFLFSYSTAPMTKAYRYDPMTLQPEGKPIDISQHEKGDGWNIGSFYITELCLALGLFSAKMDLMSMLLFVHQQLQATEKNKFKIGSKSTRQCPHMTLSLRGPVFFNDKAASLYKEYVKKCLK